MIISAKIVGCGVSYEVYSRQEVGISRGHRSFSMSRGELTNFASNPKRWLDGYREEDDDDTKATIWGNLIECLSGLNGVFEDRYAVAPAEYITKAMECPSCGSVTDSKSCRACKCDREEVEISKPWNAGAKFCEEWENDCEKSGQTPIKSELYEKAKLAVFALEADPDVSELFHCSKKQVMVVGLWRDAATGLEIPLRCLLDLVPPADHPTLGKTLGDLKTARDGNPNLWDREVNKRGYDVQAALSILLYEKATGENRTDWTWPVQESVHPYHVVSPPPSASVEFLQWGREKIEAALARYAQCLTTEKWPSFSTGNRPVIHRPHVQMIGPENIYAYREAGGKIAMQEYEPEPSRPEHSDVGH